MNLSWTMTALSLVNVSLQVLLSSSSLLMAVQAFQPSTTTFTTTWKNKNRKSTLSQQQSNKNTDINDVDRSYFESQRQELTNVLDQIESFQNKVEQKEEQEEDEQNSEMNDTYIDMYNDIQQLDQQVSKVLSQSLLPPDGLSLADYEKAIQCFMYLPYMIQQTLYESLDTEETTADDNNDNTKKEYNNAQQIMMNAPSIVSQLYQQQYQLTPAKLQDTLQEIQTQRNNVMRVSQSEAAQAMKQKVEQKLNISPSQQQQQQPFNDNGKTNQKIVLEGDEAEEFVRELLNGKSVDQLQRDNVVKQQLPRQVTGGRRESGFFSNFAADKEEESMAEQQKSMPTAQDLEMVMKALQNDPQKTFIPRTTTTGGTEDIPGGYIIRGSLKNKDMTGQELIDTLDSKVLSSLQDKNFQLCYVNDFTRDAIEAEVEGLGDSDPILLLVKKDLSIATSPLIRNTSTSIALISLLLFGIGCFAGNDNIASHLNDLNAVGDTSGVGWFNGKLSELIGPLLVITGMHEVGHYLIVAKDKMKVSPPTLLPFYVLPYLGTNTQLKESPKNTNSLFDFAVCGPFAGIVTSLIFLGVGLQTTLLADPTAMEYYPTLSVDLINYSALGGYVMDMVLGGSEGIITSQDISNVVKVHPYAIAGYIGLMVNCLDLLPLGSTDGGRMSQSIFGRGGHLIVGGAMWTALLASTIFVPHHDVLVGAWVMNNVLQNDCEIPARNEVDGLNVWRAFLGFSMWILAFLTLYPIGTFD